VDLERSERDGRVRNKLTREMGSDIAACLDAPDVSDILLNPDGKLWVERVGQGMQVLGQMRPEKAMAFLASVASSLGTTITTESPIIEGELGLLDGSRIEAAIAPVVPQPIFAIRKRASVVFTLADYVHMDILDAAQVMALREAIVQHHNLLVVGGTGSGKTTLVNALIAAMVELCPDDRLIIMEDTSEIQCAAPNQVTLRTSSSVDMNRLLKACMRLRPDRLLVGEVRGREALDLLKAWNTGHPGGVATLHANSAAAGLTRLEQLIGEATPTPMPHLIAEAVDLLIYIERTPAGRRVQEIVRVFGYEAHHYVTGPAQAHLFEKVK
jgi:type IV secretion system protein VirB11